MVRCSHQMVRCILLVGTEEHTEGGIEEDTGVEGSEVGEVHIHQLQEEVGNILDIQGMEQVGDSMVYCDVHRQDRVHLNLLL